MGDTSSPSGPTTSENRARCHSSVTCEKERKKEFIDQKKTFIEREKKFFLQKRTCFFSVPFLRRLKKLRREKKKPSEQRGGEDQKMSLGRQKRGSSSSSSTTTSSLRFCLLSLHDQNLTASAEASSASSCFWHLPHQQAGSAAKEEGEEARNNTFL